MMMAVFGRVQSTRAGGWHRKHEAPTGTADAPCEDSK